MTSNRRALIVVFDGLQPAQITPSLMPNLSEFARAGVTFGKHHPVFPTVTRVNASSLVTGCLPGRHGLAGNTYLCRDYDPHQVIPAMEPTLQKIADQTGRALLAPTLADLLGARGLSYVAIGTGTSGNAYVHNPNATDSGGATIHPDFSLPRPLHQELVSRFGPWPDQVLPNTARLVHARRIMTDCILPEMDPTVSLIWLSEPDKTQHEDGVGLGRANQAVTEADAEFGELLHWLEQTGRDTTTDILVASDHGYSTINRVVPVEAMLREAEFPLIQQNGGVAVAGNGGSALFYVHESDPVAGARLSEWLTNQDWCGALFASERLGNPPGTLPSGTLGCDGPRSPDLILSFPWTDESNAEGYLGHAHATGGQVGQGQHGSMSRYELRNVGLARGPSFQNATVIDSPTGNIDFAPTILHILGLDDDATDMDGRVLVEALESGDAPEATIKTHEAEVGDYRQQVQISHVDRARYVDWGNRV